ncbi:MAG: SDR family oxidoreductase [Pseudomonadota bacterium]|nr:SDR family oxidoreductase [Pseudomonadota bacterium]
MSVSLDGKRALITGAGGGMGRSHAILMAERGADIVIHDIKGDGAEETAEMVRGHGRDASVVVADIRDVAAFTAAIGDAGSVDILVNNAGVGGARRAIEDINEDIYNEMFEVHVRGTFFATQAVLPAMKKKKNGKIINISSIYAMGGSQLASHYAASKSAISGFTKSWARELAPWRIKVNAVAPGFIVTGMTQGSNPPEKIAEREKLMPLGEFCKPIDIAYAVAWLASGETDLLSGQVISPNAGEVIVGY